jgi:Zn finger protein HypA/HybF involved in hydrogenase expression
MDLAQIADELVAALRTQVPADVILQGFEVELGEHVDVDPDALRAALLTRVPGVEVEFVRVEGLLRCLDCGAQYPADEAPCPVCGSARAELVHGQELAVRRAWARPRG